MRVYLKSGSVLEVSNVGNIPCGKTRGDLDNLKPSEVIHNYTDARHACKGKGPSVLNFYFEDGVVTVPRDEIAAVTDCPPLYHDYEDPYDMDHNETP